MILVNIIDDFHVDAPVWAYKGYHERFALPVSCKYISGTMQNHWYNGYFTK